MIWESTILMMVIDLSIIVLTGSALWNLSKQKDFCCRPGTFRGPVLIAFGLLTVGLFYLLDLFTMFGLPQITSQAVAMAVMTDLHLK